MTTIEEYFPKDPCTLKSFRIAFSQKEHARTPRQRLEKDPSVLKNQR